jgi:hypothetical protein
MPRHPQPVQRTTARRLLVNRAPSAGCPFGSGIGALLGVRGERLPARLRDHPSIEVMQPCSSRRAEMSARSAAFMPKRRPVPYAKTLLFARGLMGRRYSKYAVSGCPHGSTTTFPRDRASQDHRADRNCCALVGRFDFAVSRAVILDRRHRPYVSSAPNSAASGSRPSRQTSDSIIATFLVSSV